MKVLFVRKMVVGSEGVEERIKEEILRDGAQQLD